MSDVWMYGPQVLRTAEAPLLKSLMRLLKGVPTLNLLLPGAAIGNRAVFHLPFDSAVDANKAIRIIK